MTKSSSWKCASSMKMIKSKKIACLCKQHSKKCRRNSMFDDSGKLLRTMLNRCLRVFLSTYTYICYVFIGTLMSHLYLAFMTFYRSSFYKFINYLFDNGYSRLRTLRLQIPYHIFFLFLKNISQICEMFWQEIFVPES